MSRRLALPLLLALAGAVAPGQAPATLPARQVVIRAFKPWEDRWTGPHWAFHAPMVVVEGDLVVTSTSDTEDACTGPLAGAAWRLFWRKDGLWRAQAPEALQCQREPCPIARIAPHRMVLFSCPEAAGGGTLPELRIYRLDPVHGPRFERALPVPLPAGARVTAYTYRGLTTDPARGTFLLTLLDQSQGERTLWFYGSLREGILRQGLLPFPDRACFTYLALDQGRAAVLGVQDIPEPNPDWRRRKLASTGQAWDYVFRRLYLFTSPDLETKAFGPCRVLDDVSRTGGFLQPQDLLWDPKGNLQILYLRQQTTEPMQRLLFPAIPAETSLEYRVLDPGGNLTFQTSLQPPEGARELTWGRLFHSPQGGTGALLTSRGLPERGLKIRNWLLPLTPFLGPYQPLEFGTPFTRFFLANGRGGNQPTPYLEVVGHAEFQGLLMGATLGPTHATVKSIAPIEKAHASDATHP